MNPMMSFSVNGSFAMTMPHTMPSSAMPIVLTGTAIEIGALFLNAR